MMMGQAHTVTQNDQPTATTTLQQVTMDSGTLIIYMR